MSDQLTLFAAGSPAKTYLQADQGRGWTAQDPGFGLKWPGLLARYDHDTSSWRIPPTSLLEAMGCGWDAFSGPWPRSGMMRSGMSYRLPPLVPRIAGNASGLLPTPLASDSRDRGNCLNPSIQRRMRIGKQIGLSMLFALGPCPSCVGAMMGFPDLWARMNAAPMATPLSRKSPK